MSRLRDLAKTSSLMVIKITYNGEKITFNLSEELKITESLINEQLKNHASSYAFLAQLRNHLEKRLKTLELNRDRLEYKLYLKYKKEISESTNRPNSDDVAKAKSRANSSYIEACKNCIEAKLQFSTLQDAVKSFESRKDLIQSLSANLRNEK